MAVCKMTKVIIACHRSQANELLEEVQNAGILEVLDAERSIVSKEWPELMVEEKSSREIEETLSRTNNAIAFLKRFEKNEKSLLSALSPRTAIEPSQYNRIVSGREAMQILEESEACEDRLAKLEAAKEKSIAILQMLEPWKDLKVPVEELQDTEYTSCITGLLPEQNLPEIQEELSKLSCAIETAGREARKCACVVICLKDFEAEVQKQLRAADFEPVSFEQMKGTAAQLIEQQKKILQETIGKIEEEQRNAENLSSQAITLETLADHYQNLSAREQTRAKVPVTEHTVLIEGWVREKDYRLLERIISKFAASLSRIKPAEGEEIPVEIENKPLVRPFESITRLYGMPYQTSVDPTVFLAPFFAVFFGLCMADVGYGLLMIILLWWILRKTQGNKNILVMLLMCGITTVIAGLFTGSWFSDTITSLIPRQTALYRSLNGIRQTIMWFDPMKEPMTFFVISLVLGYVQIQFGLLIAFVHNLLRKDIVAAICDQLTWIIMLNCLVCLGLSKTGLLPGSWGKIFGFGALVPAAVILLFSGRELRWGGRIGLGIFNLFSTVFFAGDILSYVRLMALGMVGSGFGMAINVLVKLVIDIPYAGWIFGAVIFIGGHLFNLALSMLGAFVHSLRLQFVEFFPKFFQGGGREFTPLQNNYRYIYLQK